MPYYEYGDNHKKYLATVCEKIKNAIYTPVSDLKVAAWVTPEPVPYAKRRSGQKKDLVQGQKWGKLWDCAWFHMTGKVPKSAVGKHVVLIIDVNGEACVFDKTGSPVLGLTSMKSRTNISLGMPGKRIVEFAHKAKGGDKVDIWLDAGCNDLFGEVEGLGILKDARMAICNDQIHELFYDFAVLQELMFVVPDNKSRHHQILRALTEAAGQLSNYTDKEAKNARKILAPELNKKGGDPSLVLSAIGHAHIDLGWCWPIRETIRKGARTFSTVLQMMDRYPDYVFGASQPQLYQWMKQHYPNLYVKVKKLIAQGRWEPQGAMWVESDTNLPSGESLVRQILYGKRFFRREFNKDMKILWLPDAFGFTASLPQILKKAGVDYFLTTKLAWNDYNEFPHHTFIWQGIDASKVLVHMPPDEHYNCSASPNAVGTYEKNFRDKMLSNRALMLFGIGDGGGGPGIEHLEALKREKNLDGIAPVVQEHAETFFKRIEDNQSNYKTWSGELYLERHQGTFTTQAHSKRYNRKLEFALRELEFVSVLALLTAGVCFPKKELDALWKEMLLYQFHDILPGSSIRRVYKESAAGYRAMLLKVETLTTNTYAALTANIDTSGFGRPVAVVNTLSWERDEWLKTGRKWYKLLVPAMGYTMVDAALKGFTLSKLTASNGKLENDILRIKFTKNGSIQSIYDKERHFEVITKDSDANNLQVYEDSLPIEPNKDWGPQEAWDIPIQYGTKKLGSFELAKVSYTIDGPKAITTHTLTYGDSKIVQKIMLTLGSRRIDFVTEVDWNESHKMLRTSFPVAIRSSEATCDIQFGNIKRPTHCNTRWEMAKFEVCAHKWVDLSQGDYGVALLNDCKYGYKVLENVLDLNLLRSPTYPDLLADRGHHTFTYALLPHDGDHIKGRVDREAYELNVPLRKVDLQKQQGTLDCDMSFMSIEADNVIIDTVKRAEDSEHFIIRLHETAGAAVKTKLGFNFNVKSAQLVDLMEENPQDIRIVGNSIELDFRPFEIHTLKIMPGKYAALD